MVVGREEDRDGRHSALDPDPPVVDASGARTAVPVDDGDEPPELRLQRQRHAGGARHVVGVRPQPQPRRRRLHAAHVEEEERHGHGADPEAPVGSVRQAVRERARPSASLG